MEISVNGFTYFFKPNKEQFDNEYHTKCWFIAKLNPQDEYEMKEAERLSGIWYSMRKMGCRYHNKVESKIERFEKLFYIL